MAAPDPYRHATNLVGLPTGLLASPDYNDPPLRLSIHGVRETNAALFRMLGDAAGLADARAAFRAYMNAVFDLDAPNLPDRLGRKRYRSSYLKVLHGWGFDANGPAGAVLKGWVESRFGLAPLFHKAPLGAYPSPAWMTYVEEKMAARYHTNAIAQQFDLLYEYGQWLFWREWREPCGRHPGGAGAVGRGGFPGWPYPPTRHLTLYRGVNDFSEHQVVRWLGKREAIARHNNLVSFTDSRETADTFGDTLLEVAVPISKILFCNALLDGPVLRGEGEYLAIGGDFRVRLAYL